MAVTAAGTTRLAAFWIIAALTAACGSSPRQPHQYCSLEPGMTTRQLTECGCLLHESGGLASASVALAAGGPDVETIFIVNYICPLGEKGVARVSVTNGVADSVYY
jgi:hypothetical protein